MTEIIKTKNNIKRTINAEFEYFLFALITILPILIIHELCLPSSNLGVVIGVKILWLYAWSCLISSWTQGFLNNFDKANICNPLKLNVKTLKLTFTLFICISLLNYLGAIASSFAPLNYFNNLYLSYYTKVTISVTTNMFLLYLFTRSIFVFIARLEGKKLHFGTSFLFTRNKEAKIICSGVIAALPYIIFLAAYTYTVEAAITWQYGIEPSSIRNIMLNILVMPINIFIRPWIVIILFTSILYFYRDSIRPELNP